MHFKKKKKKQIVSPQPAAHDLPTTSLSHIFSYFLRLTYLRLAITVLQNETPPSDTFYGIKSIQLNSRKTVLRGNRQTAS